MYEDVIRELKANDELLLVGRLVGRQDVLESIDWLFIATLW
jgi:hypothetical protein